MRQVIRYWLCMSLAAAALAQTPRFPGAEWESCPPKSLGLDGARLEQLAEALGGRGCVVKDGFVVKAWGDQAERSDWMSSAKPVLSTLLLFALREGLITGVDQPISAFGWELKPKDQGITFRQLGAMTSGYARPEGPGEAWAYNDYAIQLYQMTLFDKVFRGDPQTVAEDANRLGALGLQDGLRWRESNRRLSASVRDFARIAWFWLNRGRWGQRQLLPEAYFAEFVKPQTPKDLPNSSGTDTDDYLGIGSYGGGSNHFTDYGAGIYGFNWWFNATGRKHPDSMTWPDAPRDTFMSIGAGGNCAVIIPSLNTILVSAKGEWGKFEPGGADSKFNRHIQALVAAVRGAGSGAVATQVLRWQPHDFAFNGGVTPDNPFAVDFSAIVTSPEGRTFTTPGFYDGGGIWKARVGPDREGHWSIETQSSIPLLNGRRIVFECVVNPDPSEHGPLRVDPDFPSHFVYADGTRFFHLGYECDWLWALDMDNPSLPTLNPFLDKLAAYGFNVIILNIYAHDTRWREGVTGPDDYGPPPAFPWSGDNSSPDHARLNPEFWRHYDRVIEAMRTRGIQAHIMIKVYNKRVKWPPRNSPEEDLYLRTVAARYAPYPNVIWDFSKEAHNEKDLEYKRDFIKRLKEYDPYGRLVTNHDDDANYNSGAFDDLLDFRTDQQHKDWRAVIVEQRARRAWPVVNAEFGYEHGAGGEADVTYGVSQSAEENSRRAWLVTMAGGYPVYYYTYTAWDVIRPEDTPPGYGYMKHLRDFFEKTSYWTLDPMDDRVSLGYCLARPGKEYVVYLESAAPFTLDAREATGPLRVTWYHPLTAETTEGGAHSAGAIQLTPPEAWASGPVAAWVRLE